MVFSLKNAKQLQLNRHEIKEIMTEADQNLKELIQNKNQFAIFKETAKYVKMFTEFEEEQKKMGIDHSKMLNKQHSKASIFDDFENQGRSSLTRPKSNRNEEFKKEFVNEAAPFDESAARRQREDPVYFKQQNDKLNSSFTTQGTYGGAGHSLNY